jgi:hypothetical protein
MPYNGVSYWVVLEFVPSVSGAQFYYLIDFGEN